MAAHWIAPAWNVQLLATIGDIAPGHHAACYRGQSRVAFVDNIDALVSRRQLLEATQALAPWHNILGPAAISEVVIDIIEMLVGIWIIVWLTQIANESLA